ncbi:MAG TPA: copper chaperone PCu(A)C [Methylibium sp.]|nr:copper chaperone PCu(A)C [Methylibium sp.]
MSKARNRGAAWAVMAFAALSCGGSSAHQIRHGDLAIAHPFISYDRTCDQEATRAYLMLVVNTGKQSDRLTGADLGRGGRGVLSATAGGGGKTALPDGVEIPPNASIAITPPNYVIEFPKTRQALVEGGMVAGSLTFERAGSVPVQFMVDAAHGGADTVRACRSVDAPAHEH